MMQDINLLTVSPGRTSRQPAARSLAMLLLALVVAGIGAGTWLEHRRAALEQSVTDLSDAIDQLVADLEERSNFLAERNADPALVAELKRREREADDKSRVLDLLSGESVGNTAGFSAHLTALGRRHPRGLWLENIRIAAGGRQLMLVGRTLHAALVPQYLSELQSEPALAGTAFATFTMAADDRTPTPLRFALATACEPRAEDEAEGESAPAIELGAATPCVPFDESSLVAESAP
jgi:Fimbrial assembly protein (PilN)